MKVVCDADGLIKTAKAGVLNALAARVALLVGPEVYREAVEAGQARGHPDAQAIERVLEARAYLAAPLQGVRGRSHEQRAVEALPLGAGEKEAFLLYFREQADAVLSDDRDFLAALERAAVPFLTPAAVLYFLARQAGSPRQTRAERWSGCAP